MTSEMRTYIIIISSAHARVVPAGQTVGVFVVRYVGINKYPY
jgi:hypothetical protein